MNRIEIFWLKIKNLLNTTVFKHKFASDVSRWDKEAALSKDWEPRIRQIAALIPPGSSVLEFGAGGMALADYLPDGCSYTPSDIVDRGRNTIICDLNSQFLPIFPPHQVAVFSGVLEYIWNVERLIDHLSPGINMFVLSYAVTDNKKFRLSRRLSGWVNDYDSRALVDLFNQRGYICNATEMWETQKIFRFIQE